MIRLALDRDREPYRRLLEEAGLPLGGFDDRFPSSYRVACEAGAIVGGVGLEIWGDEGLLRSLVVSPRHQGRGLGGALVRECVAGALARGLSSIILLTQTAPDFFASLGFRVVDRAEVPTAVQTSPEFSTIGPRSATVMRMDLSASSTAVMRKGRAQKGLVK